MLWGLAWLYCEYWGGKGGLYLGILSWEALVGGWLYCNHSNQGSSCWEEVEMLPRGLQAASGMEVGGWGVRGHPLFRLPLTSGSDVQAEWVQPMQDGAGAGVGGSFSPL